MCGRQGLRILRTGALWLGMALAAATGSAARADCTSDMALQNGIAEQFNGIAPDACRSGAQKAVVAGLLQQAIEVTKRLEACPEATGFTPVPTLEAYLASADGEERCRIVKAFQQMDADLKDFMDAADKAAQQHEDAAAAAEDAAAAYEKAANLAGEVESLKTAGGAVRLRQAAELERQLAGLMAAIGDEANRKMALDAAAEFERQAAALDGGQRARKLSEPGACAEARGQMAKLAEAGVDVSGLDGQLKALGCNP